MRDGMPSVQVKFRATADREMWEHRVPGVEYGTYGDQETIKVRGPEVLEDGDVVEMTEWEAEWCLRHYPDNFLVLDDEPVDITDDGFDPFDCSYRQLQDAAKQLQEVGYECPATGAESELLERVADTYDEYSSPSEEEE